MFVCAECECPRATDQFLRRRPAKYRRAESADVPGTGGGLLLVGRDRWTNKGPPMMNICELAQDTNVFFNIQTELIF